MELVSFQYRECVRATLHKLCLLMHYIHISKAPQYLSTVSPRSLYPGIGTDSDRPTQLTMSYREHAPGLANVVSVSSTLVLLPGIVCLLIYMTSQTQIHSRSGLKLFCLIVHVLLLLYGAPGRFVQRRPTNRALYCIVLYCGLQEWYVLYGSVVVPLQKQY